jgi:hypothetical protein
MVAVFPNTSRFDLINSTDLSITSHEPIFNSNQIAESCAITKDRLFFPTQRISTYVSGFPNYFRNMTKEQGWANVLTNTINITVSND